MEVITHAFRMHTAGGFKIDPVILEYVAVVVVTGKANAITALSFGSRAHPANLANRGHFQHGNPPPLGSAHSTLQVNRRANGLTDALLTGYRQFTLPYRSAPPGATR